MPNFRTFVKERDLQTPFSIIGDISRRSIIKYHNMLDLKSSKINYKPNLNLIQCNNVQWVDGNDLFEVLEDKFTGEKFDCVLKKFGKFQLGLENVVYIKVELPQKIKEARIDAFKRIKYIGSETEHDITNTPHIEIARFKGDVPTLPSFEPETISIHTLRFIYQGKEDLEKTF